jgi:hypothetical protein
LCQGQSAAASDHIATAAKRLPLMGDPFLNYFALFLLLFVQRVVHTPFPRAN